ncbi:ATP-binding protein [Nanoarchaeota archaeon]
MNYLTCNNCDDLERKIKEQLPLLHKILNSLSHAFYVINVNTFEVVLANTSLGDGVEGQTCHKVAHDIDVPCEMEEHPCPIEIIKRTKAPVMVGQVHLDEDGSKIHGEVYGYPLFDDRGNLTHMVEYTFNVTEKVRMQEQLQQRQRMDALSNLAGGIAHDFNNLLTGIMGNLDLVLTTDSEGLSESQMEALQSSLKTTYNAASLIQQLQRLSEKGQLRRKKSVDVYEVAQDVFGLLGKTTDRIVDKVVDFNPEIFYVNMDPSAFHQVLLNLGTNAIHAIEEKGAKKGDCIRVSAEKYVMTESGRGLAQGNYIHLVFEDTGVGMTPEVQRKAFDPFYSTKKHHSIKGQGLGLAMVYQIVTKTASGHLNIESVVGQGTKFHLYLPEAKAPTEIRYKAQEELSRGKGTVLVVDDELPVRMVAEKILSRYGYDVIVAKDGQEGVDKFLQYKDTIDLVLLDLVMPEMSGEDAMAHILQADSMAKVIISTGQKQQETDKILKRARDYIQKPYTVTQLIGKVQAVMQQE